MASADQIPEWNLGRPSWASPHTEETRDTDCHVGPLGLLGMTIIFCHSEERSDVGIRSFPGGAPALRGSWEELQIRGLSPPKPLRGQADRRHSRSKQAADRGPPSLVPTSPEKSRKGPKPLPGFRPRRKEPKSFFPAARTAGKIPLTKRRVKRVQPLGAGPVSHQSGVRTPFARTALPSWRGLPRGNGSAISPKSLTEKGRPPGGLFRELTSSPSAPSSAARG